MDRKGSGRAAQQRALVTNGQTSGARLPESDREDMEVFLAKVNQLLPVLGVELLVPSSSAAEATAEREVFSCEIKGLTARGHLIPNGFLILKQSQAALHGCENAQILFGSLIDVRLVSCDV